jgi:hypothetical protein
MEVEFAGKSIKLHGGFSGSSLIAKAKINIQEHLQKNGMLSLPKNLFVPKKGWHCCPFLGTFCFTSPEQVPSGKLT